ncbi:MAG: phenylalanine--tRNA ligase subunit beta [Candidatus Paceibacterota bacterium]
MKVSYNWLQKYFNKKLPEPSDLSDLLTMNSFEVESVEKYEGGDSVDFVFDIKILPNRAHDCLSHRGVAKEISALLGYPLKIEETKDDLSTSFVSGAIGINILDENLCRRYSAIVMKDISVGPSPQWLIDFLHAIGQKSINNIVDSANYVMFSLGQPLHVFDLDKLVEKNGVYRILVRNSKDKEKMLALDGKTYGLPTNTLVITDENCKDNKILGIAGIKGGAHAEISSGTKNILIESANFDPIKIRATAKALGLRTDASVRFENDIAPDFTVMALQDVSALISELAGGNVTALVDNHHIKDVSRTLDLHFSDIENVLGFSIEPEKIANILISIGCVVEKKENLFSVALPFERLDLVIKEDLIEEIGRLYGYLNISPIEPKKFKGGVHIEKNIFYVDTVRAVLIDCGFSEVYTYSFRNNGKRELENPLASDKKYLRANLTDGLKESLVLNVHNAPLLGLQDFVKIFEIGHVFSVDGEYLHLGFSIAPVKKIKNADAVVKDMLDSVCIALEKELGVEISNKIYSSHGIEINLNNIFDTLKDPKHKKIIPEKSEKQTRYKKISPYPFVLRDIAVFVPEDVSAVEVIAVIVENASDLLVQSSLFDVFTKKLEDGTSKTSYAYNLVFQSQEKTLSDDEVNMIMEKVTNELNAKKGWQVR